MKKLKQGKVANGWEWAGRKFDILGKPVMVAGLGLSPMSWTPVRFHDEEDPNWLKTSAVFVIKKTNNHE